jgi:hypothetical protein
LKRLMGACNVEKINNRPQDADKAELPLFQHSARVE